MSDENTPVPPESSGESSGSTDTPVPGESVTPTTKGLGSVPGETTRFVEGGIANTPQRGENGESTRSTPFADD